MFRIKAARYLTLAGLILVLALVSASCLPLPIPGPGPEAPSPTPEPGPTLPDQDIVAPKNELTLRIEGILKDNSDGEVGVFLKRLDDGDGLVLASGNATTIFEPASSIKVLHLAHAMIQVQEDADIDLSTEIPWNEVSTNEEEPHKGCPLDRAPDTLALMPDTIDLEKALEQMMRISDNRTTQAVRVFFGQDEINQTAQMLDMDQTLVQHRIGCAGDTKNEDDEVIDFGAISHHNETTLAELGLLYEQVVRDQVLDSTQKSEFLSIMSNQSNSTFFKAVADEEANVVCLDPARTQSFKNQMKFAWKGGSYTLSGLKYRSVAGWIQIPFLMDDVVELRDYTFGVYIDGAENLDEDFSIFDPAKELLRDEIRAAMETFKPGGLVRKGDAGAGNVGRVEVAALSDSRLVTAVSDSEQNLRLIVWDVSTDGNQVTRKGDNVKSGFPEGQIVAVSLAALSPSRLAVAVRDIDGKLRLTIWDVASDGEIVKAVPDSDGEFEITIGGDNAPAPGQIVTATPTESIFNVAITAVSSDRLVGAVSDADQNLKLIVWDIDPDGRFTRKAEVTSADVAISGVGSATPELFFPQALDITRVDDSHVATAHRAANGDLWVVRWELTEVRGNVFIDKTGTRRDEFVAGVQIDRLTETRLAVAGRDFDGRLRVMVVSLVGPSLTIFDDDTDFLTDSLDIATLGSGRLAAAVNDSNDDFRLKIGVWDFDSSNELSRGATGCARTVGNFAMTALSSSRLVTAVQDSSNDLKVIIWDTPGVGTTISAN